MATARYVENCPDKTAATTNCLYVSPTDKLANYEFVEACGFVYNVATHPGVPDGAVALNSVQRKILRVAVRDALEMVPWRAPSTLPPAGMIYGEVGYILDKGRPVDVASDPLIARIIKTFAGQVWQTGQVIAFEHEGSNYKLAMGVMNIDVAGQSQEVARAYVAENTAFIFTNGGQNPVKITGQKGYASTQLFKTKTLNFEQLGIGGLDKQFEAIFRRAFASRVFPPSILQKLGIKHVKGILLFGPPGTGKTLIARQIGKMLNGKEPKIVNGPEVLNKYVGQSEENIRNLFADADAEYKEKGDASELHIIIFDEIDAVCKQRGSVKDGSGVHDTVVNQLLTKIDGVDALNNILLIGMTNRRDMLDEALLRPGRLEVQIEIGLPDQFGRLQILKIHTSKMCENSFLARDVDLPHLSEVTKNFSGAEIEGLVKDAAAYALNRQVDLNDLTKPVDEEAVKVTMADFEHALEEVKPAFGQATETLHSYRVHGMISCGEAFDHILHTLRTLVRQVQNSDKTPLLSCLLEGPVGSGKSSMAATMAIESDFPFIKVISPESLVGYNEQAKASQITRVFEDAYRSPLSVIILDDIERLLEYVAIGPRFSNTVLQTLLVLVKRQPPPGKKLLVVGTTSMGEVMESMGMSEVFNVSLHVPTLSTKEVVSVLRSLDVFELSDIPEVVETLGAHYGKTVPIKKLLLWVEMAKQDVEKGQRIPLLRWQETLRDLSS
mmetsp:Transcript_11657/g.20672  ORF Transcript_11657/g.20672 Transcript_11657/m.20672 type:complete len:723 (-) Transcript_11657:92-2260(-)|eukprot:CAMPEP_0119101838 /NCGR_PEP_ID=MMETSP1180-20130426/775_1 /TAXON_ID=3052 ORGANISM="Chlamydomonas cf sp, Strain CCMP681" /NCGR_SAMPLE_ID=MMETSP1180 /ASSEMBLY_ACC=CAM_ASM_000741 /LENGTH=722 /DNA_ID=CAMNT_0007086017 /DNA_START=115 /DNA_END=2283 /DNA_ORIENTATION=+